VGKTNFSLFIHAFCKSEHRRNDLGFSSGAGKHKIFRSSDENAATCNANACGEREDDALIQGKPDNPAGHEQGNPEPDEKFSGTGDRTLPGSRSGFHAGSLVRGDIKISTRKFFFQDLPFALSNGRMHHKK
jgi:hypothetical protein